ncbi:MAG TPA: hypothetical protein VFZ77_09940 [Acidimicrobiales bacterium]
MDEHRTDDQPDPRDEPDAGPAPGGRDSALGDTEKAQNAEAVLDPEREDEEPGQQAREQVDRLERHNRDRPGTPAPEASPHAESPPG